MKRFLTAFALLCLVLPGLPAHSQSTAPVILPSGCGTGNFPQNSPYLTMDPSGRLCDNGAGFTYTHIATSTTVPIKAGPGSLHTICVNTAAASSTITADDALTATTPTMAIASGATAGCFLYDIQFATGLTVVTANGAPDVTISWR